MAHALFYPVLLALLPELLCLQPLLVAAPAQLAPLQPPKQAVGAEPGRAVGVPWTPPPPPPSGPNLLFLYIDDLNTDIELAAVDVPNLDGLAARGVRFSRAYASHSLCNPSRVSLLSGQLTHHTQAVFNGYKAPPEGLNGVPYLPCLLRQAGYHTAGLGKVFHHPQPGCWDESYAFLDDPWVPKPPPPPPTGSFLPVLYGGVFENGPDGSLGKLGETKNTSKAIKLLSEGKARLAATGQPFAVWLGLAATHQPLIYPERFLTDYSPADVPPLPSAETTSGWKADVNQESWSTPWTYDESWGATEDDRRVQARLAYYRCIAYLDEQIGRVLGALDELQLTQSTIVVLVSDHGFSFSEHGHIAKTTGFEQDIRAPLIVAVPTLTATHGVVIQRPVEQVDLYPTLVELLGLPAQGTLDGDSLVPLLQDPQAPHGPAFYTTDEDFAFNLTRWVVAQDPETGDVWKLGAWENDDDIPAVHQLYNLTEDPGEYSNLYTDPEKVAKVNELRATLLQARMLGPAWRKYGLGTPGTSGVPTLDWNGVPYLGAPASLDIGNSSGVTTLGVASVGLSGAWPLSTGLSVQQQIVKLLIIPPDGLSVPFTVPGDPALHEVPVGVQVHQLDEGVPGGVSGSRALAVFLSM